MCSSGDSVSSIYLADVAQENAEVLTRCETALGPNTPEKTRKVGHCTSE